MGSIRSRSGPSDSHAFQNTLSLIIILLNSRRLHDRARSPDALPRPRYAALLFHFTPAGKLPGGRRPPLLVRRDARHALADDERVDVVRAFVGEDRLQVR